MKYIEPIRRKGKTGKEILSAPYSCLERKQPMLSFGMQDPSFMSWNSFCSSFIGCTASSLVSLINFVLRQKWQVHCRGHSLLGALL